MQQVHWLPKLFVLALLLVGCNEPAKTLTDPPAQEAPLFKPSAKPEPSTLRFELTLTLNDPTDLKVKEGDRIEKGQILAERQPSEQQLYQRSRLQTQLQQKKPIPEEAQLVAAAGELAATRSLLNDLPSTSRIIDPELRRTTKYVEREMEFKAKIAEKEAQISMLKVQVENAKLQAQLEQQQLADQLKTVEAELERLKVRSPYSGVIRRLKVERGTNNELVATLKIQGNSESSKPGFINEIQTTR